MKKGTAVKFIGSETRTAIEKTFIWDVVTTKNETVYLIEHPQGTLLSADTEKEFAGFNVSKLQHGKKYMAVEPREIISLDPVTTQEPTTPIVAQETEMITTTLPRAYFEELKEYLKHNREQLDNKMVRLTMKKDDYEAATKFFDQMILATDGALTQPQISLSETSANDTNSVPDPNVVPSPVNNS